MDVLGLRSNQEGSDVLSVLNYKYEKKTFREMNQRARNRQRQEKILS